VLEDRAPQPALGAAEDLGIAAEATIRHRHDHIPDCPPVETEEWTFRRGPRGRRHLRPRIGIHPITPRSPRSCDPRGQARLDTARRQLGNKRLMDRVVKSLRRAPAGVEPRHGHREGDVTAMEDRAAAARPQWMQASRTFPLLTASSKAVLGFVKERRAEDTGGTEAAPEKDA
jgi:hypothetical protein